MVSFLKNGFNIVNTPAAVYKYVTLTRSILHRKYGIKTLSGTAHMAMSLSQSLDYIERVFTDYLKYADIKEEAIVGKRILEIGPGDNLGVALKFLSKGAAEVVCLDRFYPERNKEQQRKIYNELFNQFTKEEQTRIGQAVTIKENALFFNKDKIKYIYGIGIEDAKSKLEPEMFDFIVSRAVLEHVLDLDKAFDSMHRMLKPGGTLIHKIDFRDHKIFSRHSKLGELEYLTIPNYIWRLVNPHSGWLNRKRIDYYRQKLFELSYEHKIFVTHVTNHSGDVNPHKIHIEKGIDYDQDDVMAVTKMKSRLAPEFRALPDLDLLVSGIFLVASKIKNKEEVDPYKIVEQRIPSYFSGMNHSYQIDKKFLSDAHKCSEIQEWVITSDGQTVETLLLKQSKPNILYHDDVTIDLAREFENLKNLTGLLGKNFSVPRVFDCLVEHNLMVMEKVQGQCLRTVLLTEKYSRDRIKTLFVQCGRWLRSFHDLTFTGENLLVPIGEFTEKWDKTAGMCHSYGLPASLLRSLTQRIGRLKEEVCQFKCPISMKHGDYQPGNILLTKNGITVIDISANKNDMAIKDICNFLVGYRTCFIKKINHFSYLNEFDTLDQSFLEGYYGKDPQPEPAIKFFHFLGLLESFEKICSRRGWFLRVGVVNPYFKNILERALR